MYNAHGLQRPRFEGLEEYIFDNFTRMYEKLEETRPLLDPSCFCEVRYEDLVRDPVGQLRAIYENLGLGGVQHVVPKVNQYLQRTANYKPNRYVLRPELREMITRRWGEVIRRYEYDKK